MSSSDYYELVCWAELNKHSDFPLFHQLIGTTISDHSKNELSNEFEFYGDLRVVSAPWRLSCSSGDKLNDYPGV